MKYAIPTYKRSNLIVGHTIAFLTRQGIAQPDVDLFVSNDIEAKSYAYTTKCNIIITDAQTARDKFNAIHRYYPHSTEVVVLEDDISDVKELAGPNKLTAIDTFVEECVKGFRLCNEFKTKLWGISSNSNPFYMKAGYSVGYKFIVANVYGFIATDPPITITQLCKTDYERTILYYRLFQNVVRLDYLCPITKNYSNPGGMQDEKDKRLAMERASVDYLVKTYPGYCVENLKKESMYPELKLILRPQNDFSSLKEWGL